MEQCFGAVFACACRLLCLHIFIAAAYAATPATGPSLGLWIRLPCGVDRPWCCIFQVFGFCHSGLLVFFVEYSSLDIFLLPLLRVLFLFDFIPRIQVLAYNPAEQNVVDVVLVSDLEFLVMVFWRSSRWRCRVQRNSVAVQPEVCVICEHRLRPGWIALVRVPSISCMFVRILCTSIIVVSVCCVVLVRLCAVC